MKKVLFLALAAASFTFTSCDSKTENAQEAVGEQVEEAGEAKADAMENAADSTRDAAEAQGEKIEDAADAQDAPGTAAPATTH